MRTFIAIDFDRNIKSRLSDLREELAESGADVRWVKSQDLHLTLKFLGDIDDKQAGVVKDLLEKIARLSSPFPIALKGVGAFPNIDSPKVVWVGITKGLEALKKISLNLENELEKAGFSKEGRMFRPHVTLGRVRSGLNRAKLTEAIKNLSRKEEPELIFMVESLTFFKSQLTPSGPIYTIIYSSNLTKA
jgi:2'-5' RNA ligase